MSIIWKYISYFHEGSLSESDHQLKIQILENREISNIIEIDSVGNLVEDLSLYNFNKKAILIFEILDYLLLAVAPNNDLNLPQRAMHNYREKLDVLISFISNYNDISVEFYSKLP